jgi:hypothetical protein
MFLLFRFLRFVSVDLTYFGRYYCPLLNLRNIGDGSFRLGSFRQTTQSQNNPAFGLILSSDVRLLIGLNIEDHYDSPYIKPWLTLYREWYISESGEEDSKKKLNIARFFFADALAQRINAHDCAVLVKPSLFSPQISDGRQEFTQGPSPPCSLHLSLLIPALAMIGIYK